MQALLREGQDATFRDRYARLPYCRISQFLAASFARNRRFRDFPTFGTLGGCASDERSDDSAIAAGRRLVQRGVAIPVQGGAGVRGWAPRGYPSTQTGTRKQNSRLAPRVDYGLGNR